MISLLQLCFSLLVLFHFIKIHECVFDSDSRAAVSNLDVFVKGYFKNNVYLMKGGNLSHNTISINNGEMWQWNTRAPITDFGELHPIIRVSEQQSRKSNDSRPKTLPRKIVDPANSPDKYLAYYFESDEVKTEEVKAYHFRNLILAVNILYETDKPYLHICKSAAKEIECKISKDTSTANQQIFPNDIYLVLPHDGETCVIGDAPSTQEILIIRNPKVGLTLYYTNLCEIMSSDIESHSQLETSALCINTNVPVKGWANGKPRQITKAEKMYADDNIMILKIWIKVLVRNCTITNLRLKFEKNFLWYYVTLLYMSVRGQAPQMDDRCNRLM